MSQFEIRMQTVVRPYLQAHGEEGTFETADGTILRCRHFSAPPANAYQIAAPAAAQPVAPADAAQTADPAVAQPADPAQRKCILALHGFSEFLEKYDEVIYHFLQEGAEVWQLELRGHGYSDREATDEDVVHIDSFTEYIEDLHAFVVARMPSDCERILFAHSMGGGIGATYIDRYRKDFQKVILSSPMIRMRTGKVPRLAADVLAEAGCRAGKNTELALGQPSFPGESYTKPMNERQQYYYGMRMEDSRFHTWSASYGWIRAAEENCRYAARIHGLRVKMLLLIAGDDDMVYPEASIRYGRRQKHCVYLVFPEGHHELFNDRDEVKARYWRLVDRFLKE